MGVKQRCQVLYIKNFRQEFIHLKNTMLPDSGTESILSAKMCPHPRSSTVVTSGMLSGYRLTYIYRIYIDVAADGGCCLILILYL